MFDEQANMGEGGGLNRRNFNSLQSIEGIAAEPKFDSHCKWDAMQCGYSTPGVLVIAKSLKIPNPTEEDCKQALAGNICCCGTRHPTA